MNRVLRNLLMLALTLFVSTAAAALCKPLLYAAMWAVQVNSIRHRPSAPPMPRRLDAPVRILYQPRPIRTDAAIKHGTTGTVKLSVLLNRDGSISAITPLETLPDGLTERAIEAVSGITFIPAIVGGQYTNTEQAVEFRFDAATDRAVQRSQISIVALPAAGSN